MVRAVPKLARRSRRVASVCTGTFILAAAGLLDGKRATTHWEACEYLARLHPEITVEPDPIFVRDGNTWTSAGVTAGMDLALALVAEDLGRDVALRVARQLVMYVQRPGGQAQFSAQLGAQAAGRDPLRELQAWIAEHPDADHTVERLAARVAMSPRHFARVFRADVGCTPAAYVEQRTARRGASSARNDVVVGRRGRAGHADSAPSRRCGVPSPVGWAPARPNTEIASVRFNRNPPKRV